MILDGKLLLIRSGRGHANETRIPVTHIALIGFGRTLCGGYIDFLGSGVSAHVEFKRRRRPEFERLRDAIEEAVRNTPPVSEDAVARKGVDPAALLIAVIVLASGPVMENGPWDPLNTIVAVIVLVILGAYSLTRAVQLSMSAAERIAVSIVIALTLGVVLAWPAQRWVVPLICHKATGEELYDHATYSGLVAGVIMTALAAWFRRPLARFVAILTRLVARLWRRERW